MEDERNVVWRPHSGYVELDVPSVVDMVNTGTSPERIWQTLTSPLHFRASLQSPDDALVNVAAVGTPSRTVGVVAL